MLSGEQWLDTLALAGVPAFLCRHLDSTVVITARTTAFESMMAKRSLGLEENAVRELVRSSLPRERADAAVHVRAHDERWNCVAVPIRGDDAATQYLVMIRVPTERQMRDDIFYTVVQNLPDIVSRYDRNYRHLYVNPAVDAVTTPLRAPDFMGKDHSELNMPQELVTKWQSVYRRVFEAGETVEDEFEYMTPTGVRHFLFRAVPEFGEDAVVRTVLNAARDISQLKDLQRQLEVLAQTDSLTSLLNRRSFEDRMNRELARVTQGQGTLTVLLLDVDNFKAINDQFGHSAGDEILIAIASVLRQEIQVHDFAARLGGDEFCVGLVDADPAEIKTITHRVRARVDDLGDSTGRRLAVGVSIGLVSAEPTDRSVVDVLARVDSLMYREKARLRPANTDEVSGQAESLTAPWE
jgi:diguanylate cyclase (GGDEF)-like protein/PAS domain S-box-containing protein